MSVRRFFLPLVILVCACAQDPSKVVVESHNYDKPAPASESRAKNPYFVTVEKGDTLYSIAKNNDTEIRYLIDSNRLRAPYILQPGQRLRLAKARFHVVEPGDTIYDISRVYDIDMSRIIIANNMEEPYSISPGAKLRLPAKTESLNIAQTDEQTHTKLPQKTIEEEEISQDLPSSLPDSTVKKPALTKTEPENNGPKPKRRVALGAPSPELKPSNNPSPVLKPGQNYAKAKQTVKKTASRTSQQQRKVTRTSAQPVRFSWPVRGSVISHFGPKKGGLYNDGINIKARPGSAIRASESGKVVYSGNALRGYGNLLLIRHNNGYLTAYAHAKKILVQKGQFVQKGQTIAEVGSTGHVNTPQLHFSIRKGKKALNPTKYISS